MFQVLLLLWNCRCDDCWHSRYRHGSCEQKNEVSVPPLPHSLVPPEVGDVLVLSLGMMCLGMANQTVWNPLSLLFLIALSTPLFSLGSKRVSCTNSACPVQGNWEFYQGDSGIVSFSDTPPPFLWSPRGAKPPGQRNSQDRVGGMCQGGVLSRPQNIPGQSISELKKKKTLVILSWDSSSIAQLGNCPSLRPPSSFSSPQCALQYHISLSLDWGRGTDLSLSP